MTMTRRGLLGQAGTLALAAATPAWAQAPAPAATFAPRPGTWRRYEIKTTLEIAPSKTATQAWIPMPAFTAADWIKPGTTTWIMPAGKAAIVKSGPTGLAMLHATWPQQSAPATIEVTSLFQGRDRFVDLAKKRKVVALTAAQRRLHTAPTALQPTDGLVKETADKIVAGAKGDLDKARRIYEWVVDNTFRDPKTRGCGTGDIASMLKTGNLSGKCADLNALYVGLARASGLPARDVYGIRVGPSAFGYKSLGANAAVITKAQHCRAEVYLDGFGWVPVDPADVRKVVLEEPPGKLALDDAKVKAARAALFGAWETNWLAYNDGHDIALPGSKGPKVPFLMYPQAETADGRLDSLDPDTFKYTITTRQV